jgi:hypothetical protein
MYCWGDHIEKNETGGTCSAYGERGAVYRVLVGNMKERGYLRDPGVDGGIILRRIFRNWELEMWTRSTWFRRGKVAGSCECGNECSVSIKCGEFLDWLRTA